MHSSDWCDSPSYRLRIDRKSTVHVKKEGTLSLTKQILHRNPPNSTRPSCVFLRRIRSRGDSGRQKVKDCRDRHWSQNDGRTRKWDPVFVSTTLTSESLPRTEKWNVHTPSFPTTPPPLTFLTGMCDTRRGFVLGFSGTSQCVHGVGREAVVVLPKYPVSPPSLWNTYVDQQ